MIRVREVIIVEGRYDKHRVSQAVDALIVETAGFGVFSDREKLALIRRLARDRGAVILTDSDSAGFLIRNYLKGALDKNLVKHAFIPDIEGREKRKSSPSKEGKLGVEGMQAAVLVDALRRAGATFEEVEAGIGELGQGHKPFTKADLYAMDLYGRPDSGKKRAALLKILDLPERLSTNMLMDVLNAVVSREELETLARQLGLEDHGAHGCD